MKTTMQAAEEQFSLSNKLYQDPMTAESLSELSEKIIPLIQAGRFNNIIDLISLISDQIEFIDTEVAEKMSHSMEEAVSAIWIAQNSLRMAKVKVENKKTVPSFIQLFKSFKDEDVRRSIDFLVTTMKIMGQQLK